MENQIIKRARDRPRILTDEERIKNKTTYMLNTSCYCDVCNTGRDYKMAGKHCHLRTKKHRLNIDNFRFEQMKRIMRK